MILGLVVIDLCDFLIKIIETSCFGKKLRNAEGSS